MSEFEQKYEVQAKELDETKSGQNSAEQRVEKLHDQWKVVDERIELKNREVKAVLDREKELMLKIENMQTEYDNIDRQFIRMKAQEYDKIDVLKVNADLEGRLKHLQADIEQLVKERNKTEQKSGSLEVENEELKEQARQMKTEIDYFKRTHDV